MDETTSLKLGLVVTIIAAYIIIVLSMNHNKENVTNAEDSYISLLQKRDSLQNIIDSLQTEIQFNEDAFDSRENRYEDIISEYEMGLSYLKDYHPAAYKDFHRIIGMKERYSRQLERENKTRLETNKF